MLHGYISHPCTILQSEAWTSKWPRLRRRRFRRSCHQREPRCSHPEARHGVGISYPWIYDPCHGDTRSLVNQGEKPRHENTWFYRMVGDLSAVNPSRLDQANPNRKRRLFKSFTFVIIFLASAIGTFPLFVPPFFLPLYTKSLGFSSSVGAGLVAGFNLASAMGRICCGLLCDRFGALNTLFLSLALTAVSMLAIWPGSTTLGPLALFVVVNGVSNGGFFSTMPTVVGNVFGSARVAVAMSMIVTGWAGGYLMVSLLNYGRLITSRYSDVVSILGSPYCRLHPQGSWGNGEWSTGVPTGYVLCWISCSAFCGVGCYRAPA